MAQEAMVIDVPARALSLFSEGAEAVAREAEIRSIARMGWIVVGLFFGVFLGIAAFLPLDAAVSADGVVKVSGERQTVQHRDGGTIAALNVHEGQYVRAGQVLIELAGAEVAANEQALAAQVIGLMAERARLQAEIGGSPSITPPPEFATLPQEDKTLAGQAMSQQKRQLASERAALQAQKKVIAEQSAQLADRVGGLGAQMASNRQQDSSYAAQLQGMRELAAQGYASVNRVRELERARQSMDGDYARLSADRASARTQIGEMRFRSLSLDTDNRRQSSEDLRKTIEELNTTYPRWLDARQQLENTRIRAPVSGHVVGLSVFTLGGVVAPGEKLMSIVPDAAALVVEARVLPNDADDLVVGQIAQLKFPSFHDRNMPIIEGRMTRVSADAFTDEHTGARYFTVEVTVPPAALAKLDAYKGNGVGLKPGLSANVLIPLRKRTMLQYLIEPLDQALWRSGREH